VVLGIGMGFFFIPLTTLTMAGIKREDMGNATGIYNLLRNLGGSFGVAFVTTLLSRRAQYHQHHLVEHLSPFDRNLQIATQQASQTAQYLGVDPAILDKAGLGIIYEQLLRQASMLAFNDAFYLTCLIMTCVLPLLLLMKRRKLTRPPVMH
jgi:DHA2 family multidrug resistance protein